jgi:hypothetical protein
LSDINTIYVAEGDHPHGTLTGVEIGDPSIGFATKAQKIWDVCNALGNIAFAYSFSMILIEIQVWCRIFPKPLYLSFFRPHRYTLFRSSFLL